MIYLQNITESQVLFVPKNGTSVKGEMSFRLRNTIDQDIIVDQVVDLNTSDIYYNLAITLPAGCPEGEYEYALMDGEELLSTGIAVLGADENEGIRYNKEIEYEQYS